MLLLCCGLLWLCQHFVDAATLRQHDVARVAWQPACHGNPILRHVQLSHQRQLQRHGGSCKGNASDTMQRRPPDSCAKLPI